MSRTRPAPQAVRYTVNPTRFSDMLSNRVETREWQCGRQHARPNGRSFVVLRCPFCGGDCLRCMADAGDPECIAALAPGAAP